ncbi:MAG: DUF6232 family protein [Cyanobacteria bacterium P01_H01_bin.121]
MGEQVYYQKRGVKVTSDRLQIRGLSYPLSSIRRAYVQEQEPNRKWPIICIVAGLVPVGLGFPISIAGAIWLMRQKSRHSLCLELDYGVVEPLIDKNPYKVIEVQAALGTALNQLQLQGQVSTTSEQENLRVQLLSAAQAQGGQLSVTQGVIATGKSFNVVQMALEEMRRSGFVTMDNDQATGVVVYCFPELLQS